MKKRLMAFLLTVVTAVGSVPTVPVFAEEGDEIEEVVVIEDAADDVEDAVEVVAVEDVVVEDAGSVSAGSLTTMSVVSKNGAGYTAIGAEIQVSANDVLSVSANLSGGITEDLDEGVEYKAVASIKTASDNFAEITKNDVEVKVTDDNRELYTAQDIEIKANYKGFGDVTIKIVSKNGAEWVDVSEAAKATFKLTVPNGEKPAAEEETTVSDNTVSENEVDLEALAEAQKDAEGMTAFTSTMDIDPDLQYQTIEMVVKQSFQSDALKGFTNVDKKDKKIAQVTAKSGKLKAKKVGKIELKSGDKVISVNVVKPSMPKKQEVAGGKTTDIAISGLESTSLNVVFVSSDPAKASVSYDSAARKCVVTGITKGNVTVTAYVNGKTYKTKVKVTDNADFVGYINVGTKKSFSVKGVKGLKEWQIVSANGTEASAKKKKITAGNKAGVVSVNGLNKKGEVVISGVVYIQDLDIKLAEGKSASVNGINVNEGKTLVPSAKNNAKKATYEITIKLDQKEGVKGGIKKGYAKFVFNDNAQKQAVVFKSNKAANVYVNGNGVIVAKKATGKKAATLSAKVNGKNIKIKVKVED